MSTRNGSTVVDSSMVVEDEDVGEDICKKTGNSYAVGRGHCKIR